MGVILILGSGNRVYIPLIATGVFTAAIILLPLLYTFVLSARQRAAIRDALLGLRRRRGAATAAGAPLKGDVEGVDSFGANDVAAVGGGYGWRQP